MFPMSWLLSIHCGKFLRFQLKNILEHRSVLSLLILMALQRWPTVRWFFQNSRIGHSLTSQLLSSAVHLETNPLWSVGNLVRERLKPQRLFWNIYVGDLLKRIVDPVTPERQLFTKRFTLSWCPTVTPFRRIRVKRVSTTLSSNPIQSWKLSVFRSSSPLSWLITFL